MSDSNWKQKSLTPVLLKESEDSYSTVRDLQNAVKENDILNIAVTGPYGSGKSSVLRTFQSVVEQEVKILDISLATLDADESLLNDIAEGKQEKCTNEQRELLNRKIEYSILQQLVYRKTLEALPYSRMKKIRHFGEHTIRKIAAYVIGFMLCISFALKLSILQIPLIYKAFSVPINLQNAISIISVIFLLIMGYDVLRYVIKNFAGLRPQKVSVGGNEIDVHDDGSIFNRYLEEILYFFQCTDYSVVIIEDLDRFNTTEIFLKLRELNHLINKSEMVGRTVKFIYAVKDDMFKDSSRSKFFDYITTVIPVITTTNSKDKLKEALDELGHSGEVSDEDIRDIAFHIDDMRLLYNIVNEYHQYTQRLSKSDHPLDASKMLAMMTVKNYHPHDFSELHNRKGKLYNALSQSAKRKYINFAISARLAKREDAAKRNIEAYENSSHLSKKELRLIYLLQLISKAGRPIDNLSIEGQTHLIAAIADNNVLFEKIENSNAVSYKYYDQSYGRNREEKINYSFPDIEKEVNTLFTYKQRVSQIEVGKDRLDAEIEAITIEKDRVSTYKIHELIEKFNIYEEDFFKELELSALEEDFIRRGFISDDYNDYITYFYPGIMSMSDHLLCLDMKLKRKCDFEANIDNVELFLQELPPSSLRHPSSWNYQIIDFLTEHSVTYKRYYCIAIDSLLEKDSCHFMFGYYKHSDKSIMVFADCMKRDAEIMWNKIIKALEEERDELFGLWFITCKVSDVRALQLSWIISSFDFIVSVYERLSDELKELLTTKLKYNTISLNKSEFLRKVVENGCYILNKNNISVVVEIKEAKDDITKLSNFEEMKLALQNDFLTVSWHNVLEYYNAIENKIDDTLTQFIDRHIQVLSNDISCQEDRYGDLFQSLLENNRFNDSTYLKICNVNNFYIEPTPVVLGLAQAKITMLIETKSFNYDISTLSALNQLSINHSCAYMIAYRDKLDEMLLSGVISTPLAEALLKNESLNQIEYQKVVASFTPSAITITQVLANKVCELIAIQYFVCDETILCDAIKMCTNESKAVLAALQKMNAARFDSAMINKLLGVLPVKYHELMRFYKQPKYEDNNYNRPLIESLKSAGFISSYKIEDGKIKVMTKHK